MRHERFCQEYVKDHNGSAAYLRAGYKCGLINARKYASRLLMTNEDICNRIEDLEKEIKKRNEKEVDEIVDGYRKIIAVCGQMVSIEKGANKSFKVLVDAKNMKVALDSLARVFGRFTDKVNLNGLTFEQLILERKKRKEN